MSETPARSASPWLSTLGPLIGLVLVYLFFALIGPDSFTSIRTLQTIARQTAIVGTAALGMTLVIILGGIDLSVGSIVAMTSVVVALVLNAGGGPAAAIVMAMLAGALTGLTSGTLVTRLKVAPFIVTLGMLLLVRGVAKGLAKEQKVDAPLTWLVELLASLPPERSFMIVPPGVWMLALLAVATAVVLRYTRLGAHIFSIGSNEKTARLCGVQVERVKVIVYTLTGALAGVTGVLQFSRLTVGDPTVAVGLELDVIAAVVIGGGSLSGGEGTVTGTLVGAFIMTVIRAGTSQMGLPNWVQEIVTGTIIVAAVAIDRWRHRRVEAA
ncbi:MAG: ABC transporter permease [Acidobacteria bacterium]|nr:MAG: ABC transporter permease [Acidobacteriota bacterium]